MTSPTKPSHKTIIAYADGACSGNPGPAGLGVVLQRDGQEYELSEFLGVGTNNIAELTAVLRVVQHVNKTWGVEPIEIYTDSQYTIGILTKAWKPKANIELIATIKKTLEPFKGKIKFIYVRSHAGIELNERADALARAAVSNRNSSQWRTLKPEARKHANIQFDFD